MESLKVTVKFNSNQIPENVKEIIVDIPPPNHFQ